jgi:sensor histidine kinase YesM
MVITKKTFIRELRDLFFFFLISLLQTYLMCPQCNTLERFGRILLFTFLMWIVLWKGNSFLSDFLSAQIPWIRQPVKRFLLGIVLTICYTVLAVVTLIEVFEYFTETTMGEAYLYTLYGSIIITILISFFLHARSFLLSWRKASFEKEVFEKESISARYEALKNQVSPHFLFNSLNALTNLVYEDQEKAIRFIKQLSEVYRYVLETHDKEVVPLSQELKFLESYLYLQQIRFGRKLNVRMGAMPENMQVAPLALQMLIENAIKHNVVSEEDPLTILLYPENGFLVVENNLQKKICMDEAPSPGLGLENIRKRYEYLSNEKVQVLQNEIKFIVKLPALINFHA